MMVHVWPQMEKPELRSEFQAWATDAKTLVAKVPCKWCNICILLVHPNVGFELSLASL